MTEKQTCPFHNPTDSSKALVEVVNNAREGNIPAIVLENNWERKKLKYTVYRILGEKLLECADWEAIPAFVKHSRASDPRMSVAKSVKQYLRSYDPVIKEYCMHIVPDEHLQHLLTENISPNSVNKLKPESIANQIIFRLYSGITSAHEVIWIVTRKLYEHFYLDPSNSRPLSSAIECLKWQEPLIQRMCLRSINGFSRSLEMLYFDEIASSIRLGKSENIPIVTIDRQAYESILETAQAAGSGHTIGCPMTGSKLIQHLIQAFTLSLQDKLRESSESQVVADEDRFVELLFQPSFA